MGPSREELAIAELWGIGEADPLILGLVLVAIAVCAIAYIYSRRYSRKTTRPKAPK